MTCSGQPQKRPFSGKPQKIRGGTCRVCGGTSRERGGICRSPFWGLEKCSLNWLHEIHDLLPHRLVSSWNPLNLHGSGSLWVQGFFKRNLGCWGRYGGTRAWYGISWLTVSRNHGWDQENAGRINVKLFWNSTFLTCPKKTGPLDSPLAW